MRSLILASLVTLTLSTPAHAGCGIFSRLGRAVFGQRAGAGHATVTQTTVTQTRFRLLPVVPRAYILTPVIMSGGGCVNGSCAR